MTAMILTLRGMNMFPISLEIVDKVEFSVQECLDVPNSSSNPVYKVQFFTQQFGITTDRLVVHRPADCTCQILLHHTHRNGGHR